MKYLPTRTAPRVVLAALAIPALLVGIASLPWKPDRPLAPPRVIAAAQGSGNLSAGAAEVRFSFPDGVPVPIAGFSRLSYASEGPAEPVGVRAVVLSSPGCKVALASAELLFVPHALEAAVLPRVADLGLTGVVIAATHTHAGPGGFWQHPLGERIATGPFDPRLQETIVASIAEAIRRAAASLAPARVAVARGTADDLARSRSGGVEDAPVTVLRIDRPGGARVAEITIFAAHATLLGKRNRGISGDWPARYLARGTHGLRLFFQGAIGDQSGEGPSARAPDPFAATLSARVDGLAFGTPDPAPRLAFASVETVLPAPEPGGAPPLLRRAARNLAYDLFPATAHVAALRIGPVLLVAVPGEPVARVALDWRASLPAGTAIVSLAGGYVGYVESPARIASGEGETPRTYYGSALAGVLGKAAALAARAADGDRAASR